MWIYKINKQLKLYREKNIYTHVVTVKETDVYVFVFIFEKTR